MNQEKIMPLAKGMIKHIPGVKEILGKKTGGTIESRYCYSVWMRHLKNWNTINDTLPQVLAELGPGDSLGIGLAALLSGCKKIIALDVYKYWDNNRNLQIFDELVELYRNRASIPDNKEYPNVRPELDDYAFPSYILSESMLNESLSEARLESIRKEIMDCDNPKNIYIQYSIPWNDIKTITPNYVDFIYSQAVLEHVEDLNYTYFAMKKWLKPSGLMSHTIDFKSHGTSKAWNGHWTYTDFEWSIIRGGKSFLINREPVSTHLDFHDKYGFKILRSLRAQKENTLSRGELSKKFVHFSEEDLITSGVYILSRKI